MKKTKLKLSKKYSQKGTMHRSKKAVFKGKDESVVKKAKTKQKTDLAVKPRGRKSKADLQFREICLQLERIEAVEKKRKSTPLVKYNKGPVHEKQMEFHRCLKQNRWVFGGNRSGKTECGAVETVWLALGIHPYRQNRPNVNCFVVSLSKQVQRDVAQQKILYYLPKQSIVETVMCEGRKNSPEYGIIDYCLVKNALGGLSKIIFKSCESGREKFVGTSLDFVWFDEEPPYDVYCECKMRLLDRKGFMFGTMTPLLGLTYVYNEIYRNPHNDPEIWHITMEWGDNPFLSAEQIERYTATMSESELRSRRYGEFEYGCGLVYPEFDRRVHVIAPFDVPTDWHDKISVDPGLNNPTSVHWYATNPDGVVFVIAEHYEAQKDISYHTEQIRSKCAQLNWKGNGGNNISVLIDSASNQHTLSGAKSVAELFAEHGILTNTKVSKDVFSGINRVKGYLKPSGKPPKLFIFSTCVNMIQEFSTYWWEEGDKPKKVNDHALDDLRYFISSRPQPYQPSLPDKTDIQKDKEQLLRMRRREKR